MPCLSETYFPTTTEPKNILVLACFDMCVASLSAWNRKWKVTKKCFCEELLVNSEFEFVGIFLLGFDFFRCFEQSNSRVAKPFQQLAGAP